MLSKKIVMKLVLGLFAMSVFLVNCDDKGLRLLSQADQARMMQKYEQADRLYQEALALNPKHGTIHNNYGILLQIQKRWDEALSHFQQAAELYTDPQNKALAVNNIGMNYDIQGDYDQAKIYYQKSLEINPEYYEANLNLGTIYFVNNELPQAIASFEKTLQIIQKSTANFNKSAAVQNTSQFLALCYLKTNETGKAEQIVNNLLQIDPFNERNYSLMGDVFSKKGQLEQAQTSYMKALNFNANSINAQAGLALVLAKLGEIEKAEEAIKFALQINPEAAITYLNAGLIYQIKGDLTQAIQNWQTGLKYDPNNPELIRLLTEHNAK
ncbi:tetratricopeptide repeat protein [bacterium]|nr:tetratricopeptide repeat protein [bacterium]